MQYYAVQVCFVESLLCGPDFARMVCLVAAYKVMAQGLTLYKMLEVLFL